MGVRRARSRRALRQEIRFVDTAGQIVTPDTKLKAELPVAVWAFSAIDYNQSRVVELVEDDCVQEVEFCGNWDSWERQYRGRKKLLYQIAWNKNTHAVYCLDLRDLSGDPPVYSIGHSEGTISLQNRSLEAFLASLQRVIPE